MISNHTSAEVILFYILYGVTGAVPVIAALYLLFRRANAIAPDVTPPLRLRRWAASFFVVAALGHLWWYLFLIYSSDIHSLSYMVVAMVDSIGMLITITGTQFAMLQDCKRPIWPAVVAMIPYMIIGAPFLANRDGTFLNVAIYYLLLLYVLFTAYMIFAIRKYGRWLNDNYADLENKKVWLSQIVTLGCMLLLILYASVETNMTMMFLLHVVELIFFGLLLWRVETLPSLTSGSNSTDELSTFFLDREEQGVGAVNIDLDQIERLLKERCVDRQLYLQHDLTLQQLSSTIGTNRSYLSQYFSRQGITYNTYINSQRVNHFIKRYEETVAAGQPVAAKQLAHESGFRSYSTFSLAFKQRTGQTVTAWIRDTAE